MTVGTTMLQAIRRRWWLVLLCVCVGLGSGVAAASLVPSSYTSTTQIYVSLAPTATASDVLNSSTFVEQRAQTYAGLVQGESFERAVRDATGATAMPQLSAQISDNTVLLVITATAQSARLAQSEAAAAADLLIQRAGQLEARDDGTATLQLQIVEAANLPEVAGFPSPAVLVLLGALVGAAIGVGAAATASRLNSRLRGRADVAELDPSQTVTWLSARDSTQGRSGALIALHRQLVTAAGGDGRTVLLAGCTEADHETAAAVADEMASTLVRAGLSVALVGLEGQDTARPGLSDLLDGSAVPAVAAVPRHDAVRLVGPGRRPLRVGTATNAEVLSAVSSLLAEVDAVVLLAPPVVTDHPFSAVAYARAADAVLVVGTQRSSTRAEVTNALVDAGRWGVHALQLLLAPKSVAGHRRASSEADVVTQEPIGTR